MCHVRHILVVVSVERTITASVVTSPPFAGRCIRTGLRFQSDCVACCLCVSDGILTLMCVCLLQSCSDLQVVCQCIAMLNPYKEAPRCRLFRVHEQLFGALEALSRESFEGLFEAMAAFAYCLIVLCVCVMNGDCQLCLESIFVARVALCTNRVAIHTHQQLKSENSSCESDIQANRTHCVNGNAIRA